MQRDRGDGRPVRDAVGAVLRWGVRLVGLALVALLVLGIGLEVRRPDEAPPSYSAAERAQLDAENRYRTLAADARSAAADPAVTDLMTVLAADLDTQADAVALPRSPGIPPARPATASSAPSADRPRPTGAEILSRLRASAVASRADAVDADPGPARVLASAGANQWQHTEALGAALGVDPGLPPLDTENLPDASTSRTAGSTAGAPAPDCEGTPRGEETDRRALRGALAAAAEARYGYEVAAALLQDTTTPLDRAAQHEAAAMTAAARLADLCDPADPIPAGFTITASFRADPEGELLRLEGQHVALYAGYVGTVSAESRAWAVTGLVAAVQRSVASGGPLDPLPGLDGPTGG